MRVDTSNPLEVADTERMGVGDHGMDDGREEVVSPEPVLVQEQTQVRGGVDDELVGVAEEGNVQAVEVGSDHIHWVDSSRMEGGHSFHMDSEKVEVRTWPVGLAVGCDSGVKGVGAAGVARCVRTNNYHDDRIECDRRVVASEKSG